MSVSLLLNTNRRSPPPAAPAAPVAAPGKPSIRLAALRVPLAAKLVGANLLVVAVLFGAWAVAGNPVNSALVITLATVVLVHLALVAAALRPIRDLEVVAGRVWRGDYGARVDRSTLADNEVLRVGSMFNILLDGLASDRAHMRRLAAQVIDAGDQERAAIAHELHDSTAQDLAALQFQLAAAARDASDPRLGERLDRARDSAQHILEQVCRLSYAMHPGVLDDLGLDAALRKLARDSAAETGADFDVKVDAAAARMPHNVERVLYRVAEEAIRNIARHASATRVRISLSGSPIATLEVHDDGRGFDVARVDRLRLGTGLPSMRERLALVDGWLEINTALGGGTTVAAMVPMSTADPKPKDTQ